jgi:nucleosome binding factor SPN SPT16 subunit
LQKKVGILAKDKFQGKFMAEWEECYKVVKGNFEELDVSPGIAMAMSVKDEEEQVCFLPAIANIEIYSIS